MSWRRVICKSSGTSWHCLLCVNWVSCALMSGMANTVEGVVLEQCLTQLAFLICVDFLSLSVVDWGVSNWMALYLFRLCVSCLLGFCFLHRCWLLCCYRLSIEVSVTVWRCIFFSWNVLASCSVSLLCTISLWFGLLSLCVWTLLPDDAPVPVSFPLHQCFSFSVTSY